MRHLLLSSFLLTGCSSILDKLTSNSEAERSEEEQEPKEGDQQGDCTDGEDNDNDDYIDCEDQGCANKPTCLEGTDETTNDAEPSDPDHDWDQDGFAENQGDCDDQNSTIHPNATEIENSIDDNCNDITDEGTNNFDDDDDGFSENQGDCNDQNSTIHPNATEVENSIDDNCNNITDEGTNSFDDDNDGFAENQGDCDDNNAMIHPDATDYYVDGIDQNCDTLDGRDQDGDGFVDEASGGDDCNDNNANIYPGAEEDPQDGFDTNCDGQGDPEPEPEPNDPDHDFDEDGFTENQGDCNDQNAGINPDAEDREIDGTDQNCDEVDGLDEDEDGFVDMASGGDDCNDNNPNVYPGAGEDPQDGFDTDCDGEGDPGFFTLSEEAIDKACEGLCDRVAVSVDRFRQAHVVYEYNDEIWYELRIPSGNTTQGTWQGEERVALPSDDVITACEDTCGAEDSPGEWAFDGICDDGGSGSAYSVCDLGTDCGDCGERVSSGDQRSLGVAGMDAKVDALGRMQVAYTEEGANFTALKYLYRETNGTWSNVLEIDGPESGRFNVGADVAMDIDSNNEPTFVYYDGETGTPKIYDTNGPLLQAITGSGGITGSLDPSIPEIDITTFCVTGICASDLYGAPVIGGYSGLYNSIVIDSNNDAHTIFYNHNEIQELVSLFTPYSAFISSFFGTPSGIQGVVDWINLLVGVDVVSTDSGTLNQYSSLSISGISSILTGEGGFCYNSTINDGQNIYNSVDLKADGTLCAAYYDSSTSQLKYSCNIGGCGDWDEEIVTQVNIGASGVNAANWPAFENRNDIPKDRVRLAFNKRSEPYIVYHNATTNTLNIALKENGQPWEIVENIGQGGAQIDVDIDTSDYIHIVYIDNAGSVRYLLGQ